MTGMVVESKFSSFIHSLPASSPRVDPQPPTERMIDASEREIAALYRELERILALQATRVEDQELEARRKSTMARLRSLQEAEAKRFRRHVERTLEMKPGEGMALLEKVDRFLAKHADPTGTDSSSEEPVPPSA